MTVNKAYRRLSQEERQSQMVRAAVAIAASKGLGRVVHADVAQDCGVSVPTAFRYFPNRESLLKAIVGEVARYYMAMADHHHNSDRPSVQRIREHLLEFTGSLDTEPDYATVWLEWSSQLRNEFGLWDDFLRFQEYIIANLVRSIRKSQRQGEITLQISPAARARFIVAGAYAVAQLKFMKRSPAAVKNYSEMLLHMALKGD